jgi:hypothetical protein
MKKLIFEIEKLIKNNFEVERLENNKHDNLFCYIHFELKLNNKNIKNFKEIFPIIKEKAEKKGFFSLYKFSKRWPGDKLVKICFKNKKKIPVEPPKTVHHISSRINRKKILEEGLIPQPFEKSRWKGDLNYYYEPAIFCSKNKYDASFLFIEDKYDVWEIDLTELKNKWFLDCNMLGYIYKDCFFMTFEQIKPEALKLVEKDADF